MGGMFNSYAFERMIEEYFEREGVSTRSCFRLFGAFAVSALITGVLMTIIGKVLAVFI